MTVTTNIREFLVDIEAMAEKIDEDVTRFAKRVILAIDTAVVYATPVGNPDLWKSEAPPGYVGGRARANWLPSLNVPITEQKDTIDKTGAVTIQLAVSELSRFKLGDTFWISNNVPYIERLDQGWSTQAPAGFVVKAAQAGVAEGVHGGIVGALP